MIYALISIASMLWLLLGLAVYGQRHRMNLPVKIILGVAIVLPAWVFDLLWNVVLHVLLWNVRGYTITQRLKSYLNDSYGWRYELALWARGWVNSLDEGHL